jgi:hypothetical protein
MARADNVSKVAHIGRAVKDDNVAARALEKATRRKMDTEKVLRDYGREPVKSIAERLGELAELLKSVKR